MEKFMQTGNTNFIYRVELDKAYFQHDMVYGKSKDLAKRTQSDKVLTDKAFRIASDPKYDGYQIKKDQLQWLTSFLIKNLVKVVSLMNQIINCQVSFINHLFENSKKANIINLLETIFVVLI